MIRLKYGSVAVGADGSIARRRAELQDIIDCAQRWIDRSKEYGSDMESSTISCLMDAEDVLKHTSLTRLSDAYNKVR